MNCSKKLGVEVNPNAADCARENGIEVFADLSEVDNESIDIVISNHALEHTLNPFGELKKLYKKLKSGGKIVFTVPCESVSVRYKPNDINYHLYSWSPMCIGNLFTEAGFFVIESKFYPHKWPPMYKILSKLASKNLFDGLCRIYGRVSRSTSQVRIIAQKNADNNS